MCFANRDLQNSDHCPLSIVHLFQAGNGGPSRGRPLRACHCEASAHTGRGNPHPPSPIPYPLSPITYTSERGTAARGLAALRAGVKGRCGHRPLRAGASPVPYPLTPIPYPLYVRAGNGGQRSGRLTGGGEGPMWASAPTGGLYVRAGDGGPADCRRYRRGLTPRPWSSGRPGSRPACR